MEFLKKITIFALLLLFIPMTQKQVFASREELNLSDFLKQKGLKFENPLPLGLSIQASTLDFHTYGSIDFQKEIVEEKPSPTIEPTKKVSITSVPTPTLSTKAKPTNTLIPTSTPAPKPAVSYQLSNGGLNADKLFDMSNNYRSSKGLPIFQKDDRICSLAVARAPEINAEIAENRMHAGKNSHNFPYWFSENIISLGSEEAAFNWWINDEIHRVQIEADYKYSCVACSGFACVQEFTNFQPK